MRRYQQIICFLLVNILLSALIYRDAMWGKSMLAPLDIGPNLFSQYKFMDPKADGIPQNHHIIDQFTYDLPLQYSVYRAYKSGEIPWWDPYTYGGRPLLADAHINGTDPIRVMLYWALPFELAYNWNYILRGIITGLGMFLLLKYFRIDFQVAAILALIYQFAGWFTVYFGHPWIQGSFLYFPFLWIIWIRTLNGRFLPNAGLGAILCGLIFYAGNLQSHTYLPIFAISFLAAIAIKDRKFFYRALGVTISSGIIGALVAFPVLYNQVEFFLLSVRTTDNSAVWYQQLLATPFSLAAIYPWMFGTFRTLDAARLVNMNGIAFQLSCGPLVLFFAIWAAWIFRKEKGIISFGICQASILVVAYLFIISTPLAKYLYPRCAALAGMGLILLAALAVQAIIERKTRPQPQLVKFLLFAMLSIGGITSGLAWWVYPIFREKIESKIISIDKSNGILPSAPSLRKFQINNFPQEVSISNPECAITLIAVIFLATALLTKKSDVRKSILLALLISALPVFLFHMRFRPRHPVELWHKLLAGGPSQKQAIRKLAGGLRLDESSTRANDMIFPMAYAALYQVHALQGYSALQPASLYVYPSSASPVSPDWRDDFFSIPKAGDETSLQYRTGTHPSRFRSVKNNESLPVQIIQESYNRLVLDTSKLTDFEIILRTDTYYPGWTEKNGNSTNEIEKINPCFSIIRPLINTPDGVTELNYTPSSMRTAPAIVTTGILLCGGLLLSGFVHRKTEIVPGDV
jgi:hypothetical protein